MKVYLIEVVKVDPFNIVSERKIFKSFDEFSNYINNRDFDDLFDLLPEVEDKFDLSPLIERLNKLGDKLDEIVDSFDHADFESESEDDYQVTFSAEELY